MNSFTMTGIVPAAYTPMHADFSVNYDAIETMCGYLKSSGVSQIFICGSTGEGCNLTTQERKQVAVEYVKHFEGDVIVHVGHNCLKDSADLAAHAQEIDAADAGNMEEARRLQQISVKAVQILNEVGAFHPLVKTIITRLGVPCGPGRLPMGPVTEAQVDEVWRKLQDAGVGPYLNPGVS